VTWEDVAVPRRTLLLGLAALALALPASAEARYRQFQTPSHNIVCSYSSSGGPGPFVRCDVLSLGDEGFFLKKRGKARRHRVTDVAGDVTRARVLRYGRSRRFGPFRCRSRRSGLTCKSRVSGHGFKLSRRRQILF
jgi:hypothetical protein